MIKEILNAFDMVEGVSGRNAKKELLVGLSKIYPEGLRQIALYAMNPLWAFRVTAPNVVSPPREYQMEGELADRYWVELCRVLDSSRLRQEPMATVKVRLVDLFNVLDSQCLKWFARVVNRDLKFGFQDWNSLFPNLLAEEPVMLCDKWGGETLEGRWIQEPKLDGLRSAIVVDGQGECEAISRGGKEFWNWYHIAEQIKGWGLRNVVLDGEFYAGNFGLSSSITKSQKAHPQFSELKYWIFDMLTLEEWEAQKCPASTIERKSRISTSFQYMPEYRAGRYGTPVVGSPNLIVVESLRAGAPEEVEANSQMMYDAGFEGSVLKRVDIGYIWDRTPYWLKIKPEAEGDLVIVDAIIGKDRHAGRLGALVVEGEVSYKKERYRVVSKVGGGFLDSERDYFWAEHRAGRLVGKTVEVLFQDVTTEISTTSQASLRFPRFKKLKD